MITDKTVGNNLKYVVNLKLHPRLNVLFFIFFQRIEKLHPIKRI